MHAAHNGDVTIVNTMDVTPIIDGVRLMSDVPTQRNASTRYFGSIDPLTAANWARECGSSVGTKEFTAYAKKKLNSSEYRHFRAAQQRTYV